MNFKTITLENGAKIKHLYRDSIPIVYISVLIQSSPLDEPKPSVAYLTSKMLTNGTKSRSAREIEDMIDFLAISIESKVTHDYTILTLSTTKKNLNKASEIFFDSLKNPIFPEEEFKKEVSILEKSLKQMEEEPSFLAYKNFLKTLFGEHAYGRPVEGEPEALKNLKREDLVEFYSKFYKPDKMIFSFVGDINDEELRILMKNYIENWKEKGVQRKIKKYKLTKRDKPIETIIKKEELTQSTIVLGLEGISRKDRDFYAFTVMNYILGGGGLTSRLATEVREKQGLAYSIYSTFMPYLLPGAFYIEVKTQVDNTRKVTEIILEELKKMTSNGITEKELKEAKSFLIGSFPLRIDSMRKISEFLCVTDFYELGDDFIYKYADFINNVSREDVLKISKQVLSKPHILVIITSSKFEGH